MARVVLWVVFAIVHACVIAAGYLLPSQPMGDVTNVYEPWSLSAITGGGIVGVTDPWVYPPVALVPMILAHALFFFGSYTLQWALMVVIFDAIAYGVLIGKGASRTRSTAALMWLAFQVLLGPVAVFRIDAVTVPIAIVGLLVLVQHPRVSGTILTLAAWIKIWPAALVLAAVVAIRRRRDVFLAAVITSIAVVVGVVLLGGSANLLGFITNQTGRGLQLEAPAALPYVWATALGVAGAAIGYNSEIITFQVSGPGVDQVAFWTTPILAVVVVGVVVLGALRARAGVSLVRLLPVLALALVLALIVCNKVGSPQFEAWLAAPLVLWLIWDRRSAAPFMWLSLAVALCTQLIYPVFYDALLAAEPLPVLILTARNVLLVVMLVMAVIQIVRLRPPVRVEAPATPRGADGRPLTRREFHGRERSESDANEN